MPVAHWKDDFTQMRKLQNVAYACSLVKYTQPLSPPQNKLFDRIKSGMYTCRLYNVHDKINK